MSLSVITSRRWYPWPKIHWIVSTKSITKNGTTIHVLCEDYEFVWPWMRCIGIGIHKGG